jgi:hypothetical protein
MKDRAKQSSSLKVHCITARHGMSFCIHGNKLVEAYGVFSVQNSTNYDKICAHCITELTQAQLDTHINCKIHSF